MKTCAADRELCRTLFGREQPPMILTYSAQRRGILATQRPAVQVDADCTTWVKNMVKRVSDHRLTVSLAEGQKERLTELAEANGVTLAFVVRYALTDFLSRRQAHQLRLDLFDRRAASD